MAHYLSVNTNAEQLYAAGVEATAHGEFEQAHEYFADAQAELPALPETIDDTVQRARILREDGWAYVHQAIGDNDHRLALLDTARDTLLRAAEVTESLVSGRLSLPTALKQPHETTKLADSETRTEHSLTVSYLGRLVTVQEVAQDIQTSGSSERAIRARMVDQQPYGKGYKLLRQGTRGDYLLEHIMAGARQERINGRPLHTGNWIVTRALPGLIRTSLHDPKNLPPAISIFVGGLVDLRTTKAARRAVWRKP